MIVDDLSACRRYRGLGARFDLAFDYLERLVRDGAAPTDSVIVPDEVWVAVATKPARLAQRTGFEFHERCADVHLCWRGEEQIGWREGIAGLAVRQPYAADVDFGLYEGTPDHFVPLRGRRFAVFFPGELHAPWIGQGELTKVCVKVRL